MTVGSSAYGASISSPEIHWDSVPSIRIRPPLGTPGYTVTGRCCPSYSSRTPIRFSARSSGPIGRRRK